MMNAQQLLAIALSMVVIAPAHAAGDATSRPGAANTSSRNEAARTTRTATAGSTASGNPASRNTASLNAASPIGVVAGRGALAVNKMAAAPGGSLYAGDQLETSTGASSIRLMTGPRVDLAPASSARIHNDRLTLLAGAALVRPAGNFGVETASFRIAAESAHGTGKGAQGAGNGGRAQADDRLIEIQHMSGGRLQVAAAGTPVEVKNAAGVLLARVLPGRSLVFSQNAAGTNVVRLTGQLRRVGNQLQLMDTVTGQVYQIESAGLIKQHIGQNIVLNGELRHGLVHAKSVDVLPPGAVTGTVAPAAAGAGAAGAAGAGAAGAGAAGAGAVGAGAAVAGVATTTVVAGVGIAAGAATLGTIAYRSVSNDVAPSTGLISP